MASSSRPRRVTAAGTVLVRTTAKGTRKVLLVHRPAYNDWSLPKGKVNPDEYLPGCAVRETLEESGVTARLGVPLDRLSYPVSAGMKTVSYWRAEVVSSRRHKPDSEVDATKWLTVAEAIEKVSYPDEVPLIQQAVELPQTTPVLVVRHAKAMLRKFWTGRDQARPLDSRGRRQADLLVPLLQSYDVRRAASSTSTRCRQTFKPFAKAAHLEVEGWTTLSEEQGKDQPKAVTTLVRRLAEEAVATGTPTAICGHRPVLPAMLEALGVPPRAMQPGSALIAHLDASGETVAIEFHKPRI